MKQEEFLRSLEEELTPLSGAERAQALDYYREMICDGVENGEEEEHLIAGFGSPQEIAAQILAESSSTVPAAAGVKPGDYTARGAVHTVVVETRNVSVEVIRAVTGGPVRVHFTPLENDRVECGEENGVFTFRHTIRYSLFRLLDLTAGPRRIVVDIPADFTGTLNISTGNAHLSANGLRDLKRARFATSNAHLTLENLTCGELNAKTSNGKMELRNVQGESCTAETNNARIEAEDCAFSQKLDLHTSNGAIDLRDVRSDHMEFSSSNAAIRGTLLGDMREYAVRSHTSNASNTLPPELVYPEQEKSLRVRTSNARIDVKFVMDRE